MQTAELSLAQCVAEENAAEKAYAEYEGLIEGEVPAGTKSITFVSEFVTYLIDLGPPRRVIGWWEWKYSQKIDMGPPKKLNAADSSSGTYYEAKQ